MKLFIPQILAHHEGAAPTSELLTASTNNETIFWVMAGVVFGSVAVILLINFFSKR